MKEILTSLTPVPSPVNGEGRKKEVVWNLSLALRRLLKRSLWGGDGLNQRDLLELARGMRREPMRSEKLFWQAVRNRQLCGVKFRRQQVIEQFIVDFFVPSHRLVVEIDGGIHCDREEYDIPRQQFLNDCGLKVLRFSDADVENQLENVLNEVRKALNKSHSHSPFTGEGARG
ncbi:MAG: endonuclease domain-containing protein [Deltaproteobacteria bacterium]|nr:endonuclease domain-containing protein [Deltaproteobacteria bacterium]